MMKEESLILNTQMCSDRKVDNLFSIFAQENMADRATGSAGVRCGMSEDEKSRRRKILFSINYENM